MASVAAFLYCLCLKRSPQQGHGPKRRYGALGARDPEGDSDGDDGDDPRERRRMLELSSFGGEGSGQGAYRRGRRGETTAAGSDSTDANRSRGSFPLASFAASSSNSSASGQTSNRAGDRPAAGGADFDEAGEQLQRELELFAQDDDAEERGLMDSESYVNTGSADPSTQHTMP